MVINQQKFFDGIGFQKFEMNYPDGNNECYKGQDGFFYRIDHFEDVYVIEYAENEDEARNNMFDDADTFDDNLSEDDLIASIQSKLKEYVVDSEN